MKNRKLLLKNKRILITRPAEQSQELVEKISELGGEPFVYPMIRIGEPESWEECDRAIECIKKYDGIIFTSVNGVRGFLNRVEYRFPHIKEILKQKTLYAVGEKTRETLAAYGLTTDAVPTSYNADALASLIANEYPAGKCYLLPGGNLTREVIEQELQKYDAIVENIIVYQTTLPDNIDTMRLEQQVKKKEIDIITFFSPSSVKNFFSFVEPISVSHIPIAVIGPTTAEALREYGIEKIIEPRESTTDSFIDAIVKFCSIAEAQRERTEVK